MASTYAAGALTATATYSVAITQTGSGCGATSANAVKTLYSNFTAGTIASGEQLICYNASVNTIGNTTVASGGDNNITYEWRRNGSSIASTNSASYTPAQYSTVAGTHTFTRWAKDNRCNSWTQSSGSWVLKVRPNFTAGAIATTGQTICYDTPVNTIGNVTAASGGDNNISYYWRRNNQSSVFDQGGLTLSPSTYYLEPGVYVYTRWAQDNTCSSLTQSSGSWVLTINPVPYISGITSSTVCHNTAVKLTATLSGGTTTAMTYTWNLGGKSSTSFGPTTTTAALTATMTYTVQVKNANGCVNANLPVGTIKVHPKFTAGAIATTGMTICSDILVPNIHIANVTKASGGDDIITYEWRLNDAAVATTTHENFNTWSMTFTTPGLYTFTRWAKDMTCNSWTKSSGDWVLKVNPQPIVTANNVSRCDPGQMTLSATASSGITSAMTYTWAYNGYSYSGTGLSVIVTTDRLAGSGTYSVSSRNSYGCTGLSVATYTVYRGPTITLSSGAANTTVKENMAITELKYTTGYASGATVSGLPAGLQGSWASSLYTISGSPYPMSTYKYTVTTTNNNGCANASATGTITVTQSGNTDGYCTSPTLSLGKVGFIANAVYSVNGLIVSSPVVVEACSSTDINDYDAGNSSTRYKADCVKGATISGFGDYLSACMVKQYAHILCPHPWRVPTRADACQMMTGKASNCSATNAYPGQPVPTGFFTANVADNGRWATFEKKYRFLTVGEYSSIAVYTMRWNEETGNQGVPIGLTMSQGTVLRCVQTP
jgi:hypothetical protein